MKISRIEQPFLYNLNGWRHRWFWQLSELLSFKKFARKKIEIDLPFKIFFHKSVLIRKLGNSDIRLQQQKIKNLNDTAATFEIKIWLDDEFLHGEILADRQLPTRHHIVERDHRFFIDEKTGKTMRENKLF